MPPTPPPPSPPSPSESVPPVDYGSANSCTAGGASSQGSGLCTCSDGAFGCYGSSIQCGVSVTGRATMCCTSQEWKYSTGATVRLWTWTQADCPECACETASSIQAKQSECTGASAAFDREKLRCVCPKGVVGCGNDPSCSKGKLFHSMPQAAVA